MRKIYLTVDTECHNLRDRNSYIDGFDGREYWGIRKILELGKEFSIPINFFLDVCEAKEYGEDFIREIVDIIHSYQQPIFFHLHPDYISGDHKKSFLWQYTYDEKENIFKEALSIYEKYCGKNDRLVFRAGRYGVDEDFYNILSNGGREVIDLSYVCGAQKMCHLSREQIGVQNTPTVYKGVIILPNTRFIALQLFKKRWMVGLDSSDATFNEFKRFIRNSNAQNIVFTMHSWNFIRKWFFLPGKMRGDRAMVNKFKKSVRYAQTMGYQFSDLSEFQLVNDKDEMINLCKGIDGTLLSILNNYLRFRKIGRLNVKYCLLYLLFYLGIIGFALFMLLI